MAGKQPSWEDIKKQSDQMIAEIKEWKEEIKSLLGDYHRDIEILKISNEIVNASKKRFWVVHANSVRAAILIVTIAFAIVMLINKTDFCGTIEFPWDLGSYTGKACE